MYWSPDQRRAAVSDFVGEECEFCVQITTCEVVGCTQTISDPLRLRWIAWRGGTAPSWVWPNGRSADPESRSIHSDRAGSKAESLKTASADS